MLTDDQKLEAKALAESLIKEISFTRSVDIATKNKWIKKLYDKPPARKELDFQKNLDPQTPQFTTASKREHAPEIGEHDEDEKIKRLFCMAHWEFMLVSHVEVEHGFSASAMRDRQAKLLNFLNAPENKDFTEEFLRQQGMQDFFGQKDGTGLILGSHYFYNMCYNSADNLWLLCGDCNRHKSDETPLNWYRSQKSFGEQFVRDVNSKGGIKRGVILDIIGGYKIAQFKLDSVSITEIYGQGQGLGKFTREWFLTNHKEVLEVHKQFYKDNFEIFKKLLDEAQEHKVQGDIEQYKKTINKLKETIAAGNAILDTLNREPSYDSESSGTLSQRENRVEQLKGIFTTLKDDSHHINKINSLLQKIYPEQSTIIKPFFSSLHGKSAGIYSIKMSRYSIAHEALGKPRFFTMDNFDITSPPTTLPKENNLFVLTKNGNLFKHKDGTWKYVINIINTKNEEILKKFHKFKFNNTCAEVDMHRTVALMDRLIKYDMLDVSSEKPVFIQINSKIKEQFKQIDQKLSDAKAALQAEKERADIAVTDKARAEEENRELKRKLAELESQQTL